MSSQSYKQKGFENLKFKTERRYFWECKICSAIYTCGYNNINSMNGYCYCDGYNQIRIFQEDIKYDFDKKITPKEAAEYYLNGGKVHKIQRMQKTSLTRKNYLRRYKFSVGDLEEFLDE